MLGDLNSTKRSLEYVVKNSIITGYPHRAEKLTAWAYERFVHNAERVADQDITYAEGWLNHLSICNECTDYGITRGIEFERQEYNGLISDAKHQY